MTTPKTFPEDHKSEMPIMKSNSRLCGEVRASEREMFLLAPAIESGAAGFMDFLCHLLKRI